MEMERKILITLLVWMNAGLTIAKTAISTKIVRMVPYLYRKSNSSKLNLGLALF
jgi:hypothetical protein